MRVEQVEIYSDTTNYAVLRHPGRKFPGSLIQGDTLHSMCRDADEICAKAKSNLDADTYFELSMLRNALRERLTHYKRALDEHNLPLPFSEI